MKIAILLTIVLISGCDVTAKEWAIAEKGCEQNMGVKSVTVRGYVMCKNSLSFHIINHISITKSVE